MIVWHVTLFGALALLDPQGIRSPVRRFRTRRAGGLLAYLAHFPARPHSRERLAEVLWPDAPPELSRARLKQEIATLRRHLESDLPPGSVLETDGNELIGLRAGAVTTDVGRFDALLRRADACYADAPLAHALRLRATLLHGPDGLLPHRYEEWIEAERDRLRARADDARSRLARDVFTSTVQSVVSAAAHADFDSQSALLKTYLERGDTSAADLHRHLWAQLARAEGRPEPAAQTPAAPSLAPMTSVPALLTRFFGREDTLATLHELLGDAEVRLVTLTGPGGAGKTRLANEVTRTLNGANAPRMTGWASLAPIEDAARLADACVQAWFSGTPIRAGEDSLVQLIRLLNEMPVDGQRLLVVLDNWEQLAETGAPFLKQLLNAVPRLVCLITSRQTAGIAGEHRLSVEPLAIPTGDGKDTLSALARSPAARLFLDRARLARPDFAVNARTAPDVAAICTLLEGVPLALEIAAARAGLLSPARMRQMLETDRLDVLVSKRRDTDERHRSLRNVIDWSYALLTPDARRFWIKLSVFRGGWTLDEAARVTGTETAAALEWLETLRDHSLITIEADAEANDEMRFSMLETLRQWAREQFAPDEEAEASAAHAAFYLELSAQAEREIRGQHEAQWLRRLDVEFANLRTALDFSLADARAGLRAADDPLCDAALHLCDHLAQFWWLRGHVSEGRQWYRDALAASVSAPPRPVRGEALRASAALALAQDDLTDARQLAQDALDDARRRLDRRGIAYAQATLGRTAIAEGRWQAARDFLGQCLSGLDELEPTGAIRQMRAVQKINLGDALQNSNPPDLIQARVCYDDALSHWRGQGMVHRSHIANALTGTGELEIRENRPEQALKLAEDALAIKRELQVRGSLPRTLHLYANALCALGETRQACAAWREACQIARENGTPGAMANALEACARCLADAGHWEPAARLFGAAHATRDNLPRPENERENAEWDARGSARSGKPNVPKAPCAIPPPLICFSLSEKASCARFVYDLFTGLRYACFAGARSTPCPVLPT